jgi:xanthine dehydrogenase large subunit
MKASNLYHDSATKHVTGKSVYVNDIEASPYQLVGRVVYSPYAHARILSVETDAAKQVKGVKAVLTYKDIPGANQMGPVVHDEPCLAESEVEFVGQAIVLIAAESEEAAIEAEKLIKIEF